MDSAGYRILGLRSLSNTNIRVDVVQDRGNVLARMSHPMHTYLLWPEKNQSTRSSANARQTRPTQETDCQSLDLRQTPHKQANMETECQSLDLHQTPNQQTHTQETDCQSLDLCQTPNTHKGGQKKKGARRDQLIFCLHTSSGMRIRAT